MNQHLHAIDTAGTADARSTATLRATLLQSAVALLVCAQCAFAQKADTSGIERLVAADAAKHLFDENPETRGEAALIVAATGLLEHEHRLLEMAADEARACRDRATIALGLLASNQSIATLTQRLDSVEARMEDDGVAAAFALGSVPVDRVDTAAASTLTLFRRGSWRRQQDVLNAMLAGMTTWPDRSERRALRSLFDDESNREPAVRGQVLEMLLPIDPSLERADLDRILRRGTDDERIAVVQWLAGRSAHDNRDWLDSLMQLARNDRHSAVRTAALQALSQARHLPALELAARTLKSARGDECSQAIEAMLAIGGASTRGALEQHIVGERDPERVGAMLHGFKAPPSRRLLAFALDTATDRDLPMATRCSAAELMARSGHDRAVPVLRDLFRVARTDQQLAALARLLARVEKQPTPLERLLDRPVDLTRHPERWRALLVAGHGDAQRAVLATLGQAKPGSDELLAALKVWRKAMVIDLPADELPERLREALR